MAESFFDIVLRGIDRASGPIGTVARALHTVTAPAVRVAAAVHAVGEQTGFNRLVRGAGRAVGAMDELGARVIASGRNIVTGLAAGGLAAGAIGALIERTARYGDVVVKTSERLGLGTDSLQGWVFAAEQAGLEMETLVKGAAKLKLSVQEAFAKGGEKADVLAAMGLDPRSLLRMSTEEMLLTFADSYSRLKGGQALVLQEMMGREGKRMGVILKGGRAGIEAKKQEAQDRGIVVREDVLRKGEQLEDRMNATKGSIRGVSMEIAGPFLEATDKMLDRLSLWLGANKKLLQTKVDQWTKNLSEVIDGASAAFSSLWEIVRALTPDLNNVGLGFVTWSMIGRALAWIIGVLLASALVHAAKSVAIFSVALLKSPVAWITLAILALSYVVENWGAISKKAQEIWRKWGTIITALVGAMVPLVAVWASLTAVTNMPLALSLFMRLGNKATALTNIFKGGLLTGITGITAAIKSMSKAIFANPIFRAAAIAALLVTLPKIWIDKRKELEKQLKRKPTMGETGGALFGDFMEWIKELSDDSGVTDVGEFIARGIGKGLNAVDKAVADFWDWVFSIPEKIKAWWNSWSPWDGWSMSDIGKALIDSFLEGMQRGWKHVESWFNGAVNLLTGWMPPWAREGLGLPPLPGAGAAPSAPGLPATPPASAQSEFNGKLAIEIKAPPGTRVTEQEYSGDMDVMLTMHGVLGL